MEWKHSEEAGNGRESGGGRKRERERRSERASERSPSPSFTLTESEGPRCPALPTPFRDPLEAASQMGAGAERGSHWTRERDGVAAANPSGAARRDMGVGGAGLLPRARRARTPTNSPPLSLHLRAQSSGEVSRGARFTLSPRRPRRVAWPAPLRPSTVDHR